MTPISSLLKDDFEYLSLPTQVDSFGDSPVSRALTSVAQEVAELLQQSHHQTDGINQAETIAIRAVEPEYRQSMIDPLTARELEVLQLIVEGYNNIAIARKLYVTQGIVKSHVRNILMKLYVSDRTEAAIRALRSGLVH